MLIGPMIEMADLWQIFVVTFKIMDLLFNSDAKKNPKKTKKQTYPFQLTTIDFVGGNDESDDDCPEHI